MSMTAPTPPPDDHPNFTITDQQHEPLFEPNGDRSWEWLITFQTASGTVGHITVPQALYSAPYVKRQIEDQVREMNHVEALGNG